MATYSQDYVDAWVKNGGSLAALGLSDASSSASAITSNGATAPALPSGATALSDADHATLAAKGFLPGFSVNNGVGGLFFKTPLFSPDYIAGLPVANVKQVTTNDVSVAVPVATPKQTNDNGQPMSGGAIGSQILQDLFSPAASLETALGVDPNSGLGQLLFWIGVSLLVWAAWKAL